MYFQFSKILRVIVKLKVLFSSQDLFMALWLSNFLKIKKYQKKEFIKQLLKRN